MHFFKRELLWFPLENDFEQYTRKNHLKTYVSANTFSKLFIDFQVIPYNNGILLCSFDWEHLDFVFIIYIVPTKC